MRRENLLRWETMLAAVLVFEFILFSTLSPYFLSVDTLSDATFNFTERAIVALPLALLIIAGEIDISVAAIIALSSVAMGLGSAHGMSTAGIAGVGLGTGLAAGCINTVVGSGTLITFPTLVALGFPPVTATMSNAVGLVAGGVSGTWGYRRELRGQWDRLRWQIPASLVGAGIGAWLLLHLPEKVFTRVVPVLLIGALILVMIGPRIQAWAKRRAELSDAAPGHVSSRRMFALVVATFAVGIYGGYFTAAQGILLMGAMGALLPESMQRMNAAKNLLSLLVNIVAAVAYTAVAFDRISWVAAGLIAVGSLIGGFLGAHYGRRLSPNALRAVIVVVGLIGLYRLLTV